MLYVPLIALAAAAVQEFFLVANARQKLRMCYPQVASQYRMLLMLSGLRLFLYILGWVIVFKEVLS